MLALQIIISTGKTGIPGSLCKAMGPAVRLWPQQQQQSAVAWTTQSQVKGPVQPKVLLQAPSKEATQWACKGCPQGWCLSTYVLGVKGLEWKELPEEPCKRLAWKCQKAWSLARLSLTSLSLKRLKPKPFRKDWRSWGFQTNIPPARWNGRSAKSKLACMSFLAQDLRKRMMMSSKELKKLTSNCWKPFRWQKLCLRPWFSTVMEQWSLHSLPHLSLHRLPHQLSLHRLPHQLSLHRLPHQLSLHRLVPVTPLPQDFSPISISSISPVSNTSDISHSFLIQEVGSPQSVQNG